MHLRKMKIIIHILFSIAAATSREFDEFEFPHSDDEDEEIVVKDFEEKNSSNETLPSTCTICKRRISNSEVTTSLTKQNKIVHSNCYARYGAPTKEPCTPRNPRGLRRVASSTLIES